MIEIIEKKSRFIGYAARVTSETEAKNFIADIARGHKKSRHVAFAYVLSATAETSATAQGLPKCPNEMDMIRQKTPRKRHNVIAAPLCG